MKRKNKKNTTKQENSQSGSSQDSRYETKLGVDTQDSLLTDEKPQELKETIGDSIPSLSDLAETILILKNELETEKEKRLRVIAEYDNYRKRTQTEKKINYRQAKERIILNLLPVLDDLERLFNQDFSKLSYEDLVKATSLIGKKFSNILSAEGVKEIEVIDQQFDAEIHEAVAQSEDKDKPSGMILNEAEKGYSLGEIIIRHPKVIVNSFSEDSEDKDIE